MIGRVSDLLQRKTTLPPVVSEHGKNNLEIRHVIDGKFQA